MSAAPIDSRKFIDEIHHRTSRWVSWCTPGSVAVGTYGTLDDESGHFVAKGSIYNEKEVAEKIPELLEEQYAPQTGPGVDELYTAFSTTMTTGGDTSAPGLVLEITNDKPGAFLVMSNAKTTYLPTEVPLTTLRKLATPRLLEYMFLITEIISAPSYAMGLVKRGSNQTVSISQDTNGAWQVSGPTAVLHQGHDPEGKAIFPVLLRLKKVTWAWKRWHFGRIQMRDSPPPEPSNDKIWEDLYIPWANLDDDGVEFVPNTDLSDSETDESDYPYAKP